MRLRKHNMLKTVKMDSVNTENTCVVGSPYAMGPLSSCLSVTLVYCGQTFGWIKVKLGVEVGLGPDHVVLDGDPASPPPKRRHSPQFSAHASCGQTAGWIKMPLGTEVGLSPGDVVLDGHPAPAKGHSPNFRPMSILWPDG